MKNRTLFSVLTSIVVSVVLANGSCFAQNAPCTYTLTPPNHAIGADGGHSNIANVATTAECIWTAVSNVPWVRVVFGPEGMGIGSVLYTVAQNPGPNARRGTMTIAGQTFIVSQASPVPAPCTITVPSGATVSWIRFTHRFSITASTDECPWSIKSHVPWIFIRTRASGRGNILVVYDIEQNSGPAPRVGRILVNGKSFLVTQKSQGQ